MTLKSDTKFKEKLTLKYNMKNLLNFHPTSQKSENFTLRVIPHETIICDDRDPPWINKEIKKLMLEKNLAFKSYCLFQQKHVPFRKIQSLTVSTERIYQRIEREVLH